MLKLLSRSCWASLLYLCSNLIAILSGLFPFLCCVTLYTNYIIQFFLYHITIHVGLYTSILQYFFSWFYYTVLHNFSLRLKYFTALFIQTNQPKTQNNNNKNICWCNY